MYAGEDIKQEQEARKQAIMKGFGFEQSDSLLEKAKTEVDETKVEEVEE